MSKFVFYKDSGKRKAESWRWYLSDGNCAKIAKSEEAYLKSSLVRAINSLKNKVDQATPVLSEEEKKSGIGYRFEYFRGKDGNYYWRLKAGNHQIVATGGEGFASPSNVKRSIENVKVEIGKAEIEWKKEKSEYDGPRKKALENPRSRTMKRFLEPTNDLVFKRIFGNEKETGILIDFLNAVLEFSGKDAIVGVEIANPQQVPRLEGLKDTIVDVRARDAKGREFVVEMQLEQAYGFLKRSLFYTSKAYVEQLEPGRGYAALRKVYFVGILDFACFEGNRFLSNHLILDKRTLANEVKDFEFCFVELPKFRKRPEELEGAADKWIYFLKHAGEMPEIPEALRPEENLGKAFRIAEISGWSRAELDLYERRQHFIFNQKDEIETARSEGMKKGRQEGKEEGRQEGKEEGRQEGKEEGRKEGFGRAVASLSSSGLDAAEISRLLGIGADETGRLLGLYGGPSRTPGNR